MGNGAGGAERKRQLRDKLATLALRKQGILNSAYFDSRVMEDMWADRITPEVRRSNRNRAFSVGIGMAREGENVVCAFQQNVPFYLCEPPELTMAFAQPVRYALITREHTRMGNVVVASQKFECLPESSCTEKRDAEDDQQADPGAPRVLTDAQRKRRQRKKKAQRLAKRTQPGS